MPKMTATAAQALADKTSDAYSADRYSNNWIGCIEMLSDRGYNEREIEAILRSKWMRWAADVSGNEYGFCDRTDLALFLDDKRNGFDQREVDQLVKETF